MSVVRSPLALVNPVCSVVVVVRVVIGERGSEERESQLSRWLPLQGTCVKIAIHQQPIPSHPSWPEEEEEEEEGGGRHVPIRWIARSPDNGALIC